MDDFSYLLGENMATNGVKRRKRQKTAYPKLVSLKLFK